MLKPLLDPIGYPPLLAFLLAVLLVDLPVLLGMMLHEGKKRNGHYSWLMATESSMNPGSPTPSAVAALAAAVYSQVS